MNSIVETKSQVPSLAMTDSELIGVLQTSIYPGASIPSIKMAIEYCRAAGLDVMLKPVHIVPMWDGKAKGMRDVIMPGVGLYRIQASRTGSFAGMGEPEFGPMINTKLGGVEISYPEFAKVTVKRILPNGSIAEFTAVEYWTENYAVKGGQEKSVAPNSMWAKRPRGQIAKCAAAQALRIAFPELGAQPTADEMEGKIINGEFGDGGRPPRLTGIAAGQAAAIIPEDSDERDNLILDLETIAIDQGVDAYGACWNGLTKEQRKLVGIEEHARLKKLAIPDAQITPHDEGHSHE